MTGWIWAHVLHIFCTRRSEVEAAIGIGVSEYFQQDKLYNPIPAFPFMMFKTKSGTNEIKVSMTWLSVTLPFNIHTQDLVHNECNRSYNLDHVQEVSGRYMHTKTTRLYLHLMEERKLWGTSWTSTCKPLVLHQYWVPFLKKPSMWWRLFEKFLSLKHHFCSPACFLWNYTDNFEESLESHGW